MNHCGVARKMTLLQQDSALAKEFNDVLVGRHDMLAGK